MSDLVETVARAIHELGEPGIVDCRDLARAAIVAVLGDMAEPSAGMVDAGALVRTRGYAVDDIWQAMLAQYRKEMLPAPPQEPLP